MSKCPRCEAVISHVNITALDGKVAGRTRWKCIAHTCPQCSTVLSVQIDPVALKTDTVSALLQALSDR